MEILEGRKRGEGIKEGRKGRVGKKRRKEGTAHPRKFSKVGAYDLSFTLSVCV